MLVRVPASLRRTGLAGALELDIPASATLRSVLDEVERRIPGARAKLLDPEGRLYRYVNVYVNGVDVRFEGGLGTEVREGDEVLILPAISGG